MGLSSRCCLPIAMPVIHQIKGALADDPLITYSAAQMYPNYAYAYYTLVFCVYAYVYTRVRVCFYAYTRMYIRVCLYAYTRMSIRAYMSLCYAFP